MKKFLSEHKFHLLFFAAVGLIGGWFTGAYSMETLPDEVMALLIEQMGSVEAALVIGAVQVSLLYGLLLGALGIWLAKKVGLWKPVTFGGPGLKAAGLVSLMGGIALIGFDLLFSQFNEFVASAYATKPTVSYCIASVTYGGVIEEILMRLFLMSLLALVLWKLAARKQTQAPEWVFVAANVVAALLFSAGHLPATAAATALTPLILFRCFLLNGGLGLLFGRLYRKHGIQYAMLAHAGCHVVSKLIWMLFI